MADSPAGAVGTVDVAGAGNVEAGDAGADTMLRGVMDVVSVGADDGTAEAGASQTLTTLEVALCVPAAGCWATTTINSDLSHSATVTTRKPRWLRVFMACSYDEPMTSGTGTGVPLI